MADSIRQMVIIAIAGVMLLVGGCASSVPKAAGEPVKDSPCPPDLTPTCAEYVGRTLRCFCGSKDDLREILEPETQPPH